MGSRCRAAVLVVGAALVASCGPAGQSQTAPQRGSEPAGEPQPLPAGDPWTTEDYITASHDACDQYLGALFVLARDDEQLDTSRDDASRDLFLRRADDIAQLYEDYAAEVALLAPPAEIAATHEEMVALMRQNYETIAAIGLAHDGGDEQQAAELLQESTRIDDELAARQDALGIRPCGR